MTKTKILIIEDDQNLAKLLEYNLAKVGFVPIICDNGDDALNYFTSESPDLIVLDIMLPGQDGIEICNKIKAKNKNTPIIFHSAKGAEIDRILGFEVGADDYMVKPFSPTELILRIKAILKRYENKNQVLKDEEINFGILNINLPKHKVFINSKEINLTKIEFKLLVILLGRKGRVQSRNTLLSDIWDISAEVTTRTVDAHIKRLREKLGAAEKYIETIRGVGYRFLEKLN